MASQRPNHSVIQNASLASISQMVGSEQVDLPPLRFRAIPSTQLNKNDDALIINLDDAT